MHKNVPTPHTCLKLNWEFETLFYWYKTPIGKTYELCIIASKFQDDDIVGFLSSENSPKIFDTPIIVYKNELIPAPQVHELREFIDKQIEKQIHVSFIDDNGFLHFAHNYDNMFDQKSKYVCEYVSDSYLCEAYARLCIKIKESKLFENISE